MTIIKCSRNVIKVTFVPYICHMRHHLAISLTAVKEFHLFSSWCPLTVLADKHYVVNIDCICYSEDSFRVECYIVVVNLFMRRVFE